MQRFVPGIGRWLADPARLCILLCSLIAPALVLVYIAGYGQNAPIGDDWHLGSAVATAVADARLTLADLLAVDDGHRTLFTNLITALLTLLTRWNIHLEMLILAGLAFLSAVLLLALSRRARLPTGIVLVISLLMFPLNREISWLSWRHSGWHFAVIFLLAALLVLERSPVPSRRALMMAAIFALAATFSVGVGMLLWLVLLVVCFLLGYRTPIGAALWIIAALLSVSLYLHDSGIQIAAPPDESAGGAAWNQVQLPTPEFLLRFGGLYLARPIFGSQTQADLMIALSATGLLVFALNAAYLWRHEGVRSFSSWLGMAAFALAAPLLITQGRGNDAAQALRPQYMIVAVLFWVALAALITSVYARLRDTSHVSAVERGLLVINTVTALCLLLLYTLSSALALQTSALYWGRTMQRQDRLLPEEGCLRAYLFTRDASCMESLVIIRNRTDDIAARRLATFAHMEPVSILPPALFQDSSAVVLIASQAWHNVHIRDWLLAGVDESHITHVLPVGAPDTADVLALPLPPSPIEHSPSWDREARQVWVVRVIGSTTQWDAVDTALATEGYTGIYRDVLNTPIALEIRGYERLESMPGVRFHVGDSVTFEGWRLDGSVDMQPCDTLTMDSLWRASEVLPSKLAITLVLADERGIGVVRNDGPIAGIQSAQIAPAQLYLDRRALQVPCDLAPGNYPLLIGLYNYDTAESLPVTTAQGAPSSNLMYLTTLRIMP